MLCVSTILDCQLYMETDHSYLLLISSECIGRSGAKNDRAREAGSINQVSNIHSDSIIRMKKYQCVCVFV
jgi:hypothetical protein